MNDTTTVIDAMPDKKPSQMKIECSKCQFSKVVEADSEKLPAEVVREHGKRTGHKVRVFSIEE